MTSPAALRPLWTSAGVWMVVLMSLFILASALRAFVEPANLASAMGLPLTDAADDSYVVVYGIRSLFLSVFALALVARGDIRTIESFVLLAVLMPIGDATLVAMKGAALEKLARHAGSGAFLVAAWFMLRRFRLARDAKEI